MKVRYLVIAAVVIVVVAAVVVVATRDTGLERARSARILEVPPGAVLRAREEAELGFNNDGGTVMTSLASPKTPAELLSYYTVTYPEYSFAARSDRFGRNRLPGIAGVMLLGSGGPYHGVQVSIASKPFAEGGSLDYDDRPVEGMRSYAIVRVSVQQ